MQDFIELVRKMRDAQKGFFKADPNSAGRRRYLQESKSLEKQVDDFLAGKGLPPAQQGLF